MLEQPWTALDSLEEHRGTKGLLRQGISLTTRSFCLQRAAHRHSVRLLTTNIEFPFSEACKSLLAHVYRREPGGIICKTHKALTRKNRLGVLQSLRERSMLNGWTGTRTWQQSNLKPSISQNIMAVCDLP